MAIYLNDWAEGGEATMLADFGIGVNALDGAKVIVASYTDENYEGDAYVLFERDAKLWEVHGSHCSCYGLSEDSYTASQNTQWQPEEISAEAILHRINKGTWGEEAKLADTVRAMLAARDAK